MAGLRVWMRLLRPRVLRNGSKQGSDGIPPLPVSLLKKTDLRHLDPEHLADYREICGSRRESQSALRTALPPCYLQHLAGELHLELLADPAFPVSPLGLIHVENEITERRPLLVQDLPIELTASLADGGAHPAGRLIRIETQARTSTASDGSEDVPWRSVITALLPSRTKRGGKTPKPPRDVNPANSESSEEKSWEREPPWALDADLGRRFSFLMGDFNPIHLWPWSAWPGGAGLGA